MDNTSHPKVLVVENPDGSPTVLTLDEIDVVETSSYPLNSFVSDEELSGMDAQHYADLAKQFPTGSAPYELLMDFQQQFETHLAARGVIIVPDDDQALSEKA